MSKLKFRVMEYGVYSYFPKTQDQALLFANEIIERNGCGLIEKKVKNVWKIIAKFDNWDGIVTND